LLIKITFIADTHIEFWLFVSNFPLKIIKEGFFEVNQSLLLCCQSTCADQYWIVDNSQWILYPWKYITDQSRCNNEPKTTNLFIL